VKVYRVTNKEMMDEAFKIRVEVFVMEQNVPLELEMDEYDDSAIHVVVLNDNADVVGCGRLIIHNSVAKIGRVAIKKEYRKNNYGKAICEELIKIAMQENAEEITLGAQLAAVGFYKKIGFLEYGDIFLDANIDHINMEYVQR
jgi:predicted GNAT family N-acyltransferase